ncbi:chloride channel CLIC-like protein 1 isoform X2 [Xyrauchen texanus]|uniref:chloride channel CLIC-like protein 1 isoform X2 n=1 Tax=Xyrauchen texanus TaxID=154827 RepID=UPI002241A691|nr:chloride channel CLIC-like protein 1 isoform X2 [Xyrauchen texanus]
MPSCCSFVFRSSLVFCGLFVIGCANIIHIDDDGGGDDDGWLNPYDMYYDPTSKRMRYSKKFDEYRKFTNSQQIKWDFFIVTAIMLTTMWSAVSWIVQFRRMFAACLFISLIWNWIEIYVAITGNITSFITDPQKQIGQDISEFLIGLLKDPLVIVFIHVLVDIAAVAIIVKVFKVPVLVQHQAPQHREAEGVGAEDDTPQPLQVHQMGENQAGNGGNQGINPGDDNAIMPQHAECNHSMSLPNTFDGRPEVTQTVEVETLRSTGNISSEDESDPQLRRQEDHGIGQDGEPDAEHVQREENESDPSTIEKMEQKVTKAPSQQKDVKTGADQRNDVQGSGDVAAKVEDYDSGFTIPVQETWQ